MDDDKYLTKKQILKASAIIWKSIENIHDEEKHQATDADACDICLNSYPIRVAVWAEEQARASSVHEAYKEHESHKETLRGIPPEHNLCWFCRVIRDEEAAVRASSLDGMTEQQILAYPLVQEIIRRTREDADKKAYDNWTGQCHICHEPADIPVCCNCYKDVRAFLVDDLKENLKLAGWREGMSAHQEQEMGDYRRGQIDTMHWMERRMKRRTEPYENLDSKSKL
jgi:hypothetical protein